ncbi:uncharacterized protein LOC115928202 [Strongylocentrotus purpuratus]|uniref:Uncharacterized protein n=1 Tax=Strongylocentrotus purpuratus TaxID=7668 RepID=A0A7M7PI27_STRPU|nr:uncharacterized protein LOC115928202 [Strongylocentrotus purpuratus]
MMLCRSERDVFPQRFSKSSSDSGSDADLESVRTQENNMYIHGGTTKAVAAELPMPKLNAKSKSTSHFSVPTHNSSKGSGFGKQFSSAGTVYAAEAGGRAAAADAVGTKTAFVQIGSGR